MNYKEININQFFNTHYVNSDIYIKISDYKYVKIIKKDILYTYQEIKKYQNRGLFFFYVRENDYNNLVNFFKSYSHINLRTNNLEQITPKSIKLNLDRTDRILKMSKQIGISDKVLDLSNKILIDNYGELKKMNKDIYSLLNEVFIGDDYLKEKCLFLSIILIEMSGYLAWSTENILTKLTYAALLHDVYLTDSTLGRTERYKLSDYTKEQVGIILNHPVLAFEMIFKSKEMPNDLEKIILWHHELPHGNGFPKQMDSLGIIPISCLFNVALYFTSELYANWGNKEEMTRVIAKVKEEYSVGNYKNIIENLDPLFHQWKFA